MDLNNFASMELVCDSIKERISRLMPMNPLLFGWQSYAQCDEDGIIRECLDRIAKSTQLSGTFIEIGCGNGLENNTHQLMLDGYSGCWIDGSQDNINYIEQALGGLVFSKLLVLQHFLTIENIGHIIQECAKFLNTIEVDLFSLDIDGNDMTLMPIILNSIKPKLICVEYNAKFVPPTKLVMTYSNDHRWQYNDYYGASLQSWVESLNNYILVCCNMSGVNAFFVRKDLMEFFTVYDINLLYQPSRHFLVGSRGHIASINWLKQILSLNAFDRFNNS